LPVINEKRQDDDKALLTIWRLTPRWLVTSLLMISQCYIEMVRVPSLTPITMRLQSVGG
jgi:hypothetical protein